MNRVFVAACTFVTLTGCGLSLKASSTAALEWSGPIDLSGVLPVFEDRNPHVI